MPSNTLICLLLPTIFPGIRVSSKELGLDIISLSVGTLSSSSVLMNIVLPLPKQNSYFQSPKHIEH